MRTFRLTVKAKSDLIGIAKYTEQKWGRKQRNTYLKNVDRAFKSLTKNSKIGKNCDDIRSGYRKYPEGKHLIFYRVNSKSNRVEIIRVLHQSMDIDQYFC